MKLSQCKLGEIVKTKEENSEKFKIGHIVGLTVNYAVDTIINHGTGNMETIPLVKFPLNDVPVGIHHSNLELLK